MLLKALDANQIVVDPTAHLRCYKITPEGHAKPAKRTIIVHDAFGAATLAVAKPKLLCVPSEVDGVPLDLAIDPFECYAAKLAPGEAKRGPRGARLEDGFDLSAVVVTKPRLFCNPVSVDGGAVRAPATSLQCLKNARARKACVAEAPQHAGGPCKQERDCGGTNRATSFCVKQEAFTKRQVEVQNELGAERSTVVKRELLCVPSDDPMSP